MKIFRRFAWILWVLLGLGVGYLIPTLQRPPLLLQQDAVVTTVAPQTYTSTFNKDLGGYIDIQPKTEVKSLLIFYPGGLVRPQAYEWLGVALIPLGIRTIIPMFPLDLAVTDQNRADKLLDALKPEVPVLMAGHSLGGAMISSYLADHPGKASGLILMAAYPPNGKDLSGQKLPVLTLAAEKDGLASMSDIDNSLKLLPPSTQKVVIEGSVHAFFGRYGPQQGDGLPTISRDVAEQKILSAITAFVQQSLSN